MRLFKCASTQDHSADLFNMFGNIQQLLQTLHRTGSSNNRNAVTSNFMPTYFNQALMPFVLFRHKWNVLQKVLFRNIFQLVSP